MGPHHLVAILALLLALAAFAAFLLSDPERYDPGPPRTTAPPVVALAAAVAPIGGFDQEFYVNEWNPFVPYAERLAEHREIADRKKPPTARKVPRPPPGPPQTIEQPKMVWPKGQAVEIRLPECVGLITHGPSQRQVLVARLPGGAEQHLEPGGAIGGFELLEITRAGARFRDEAGAQYDVPYQPVDHAAAAPRPDDPADAANAPGPAQPAQPPAGMTPAQRPGAGTAGTDARPGLRPAVTIDSTPPPDRPRPPRPTPAPDMVPRPPR